MTTVFVSRHPGAADWLRRKGHRVDRVVEHLRSEEVLPGDVVIGSLPLQLIAHLCESGARFLHLSIEMPRECRGRELEADEMERYGARLEEFVVRRAGPESAPRAPPRAK